MSAPSVDIPRAGAPGTASRRRERYPGFSGMRLRCSEGEPHDRVRPAWPGRASRPGTEERGRTGCRRRTSRRLRPRQRSSPVAPARAPGRSGQGGATVGADFSRLASGAPAARLDRRRGLNSTRGPVPRDRRRRRTRRRVRAGPERGEARDEARPRRHVAGVDGRGRHEHEPVEQRRELRRDELGDAALGRRFDERRNDW